MAQVERQEQDELAKAVREVARALSRQNDARVQWAAKVQEAGNLVLASMVLGQMFSGEFNPDLALAGLALFVGAYLFAYGVMRGGGRR